MTDYSALAAQYGGTPVGDSPAVDYSALAKKYGEGSNPDINPATQGGYLSLGPFQTPISTSPMIDQLLSGMGSGISDLGLAAKQRFGYANEQDVARKRQMDLPVRATTAGAVGNFAGNALPALATLPFPMLNTIGGAALTGAALGAFQPTGQGESALLNTGAGAAGGALGQAGANLIGRAIAPIRSSLSPEIQRLADVAQQNGIPLDLAQRTGSKPLQTVNSVLGNLPGTAGIEQAKNAAQRQAFTQAVLAKTGTNASQATPDVINAAFNRVGGTINDVAKRNSINIDGPLVQDLITAYDKYQNVLDPNQRAIIGNNINSILNEKGILSGETYQATRSTLGRLTKNPDTNVVQAAKDVRQALDDAATRSINPPDLAAWEGARQQYANLMPISKAMKASNAVSGDIPPAQLFTQVSNANPRNFVRGKGDLNDLARIGTTFLRDPVPNSGTAQRALYQGLLTGGIASGIGAGTYAGTGDPMKAMGAAGVGLFGPLAIQKLLSSGLLSKYLVSGPDRALLGDLTSRYAGPLLVGAGAASSRP